MISYKKILSKTVNKKEVNNDYLQIGYYDMKKLRVSKNETLSNEQGNWQRLVHPDQ